MKERERDREADRQTDRDRERQTDRQIYRQTDRLVGRQTGKQADKDSVRTVNGVFFSVNNRLDSVVVRWYCSLIIWCLTPSQMAWLPYSDQIRVECTH